MSSQNILTQAEFLQRFPFKDHGIQGKPIHFLWHFDLDASVADLWPHLIDTSTFNKLLQLPEMKFVEREGYLYGESKNAGIMLRWKEVPWQWQHEFTLTNARIYSEGFAKLVNARYYVEKIEDEKTRLYVYFGWVPKGFFGKLILSLGFPAIKGKYKAGLAKVIKTIKESMSFAAQQRELQLGANKPELRASAQALIAKVAVGLKEDGFTEKEIDLIKNLVIESPEEDIVRIKAKKLAEKWKIDAERAIRLFLHATALGMFNISWDVICPHCRGTRNEVKSLGEMVESAECEVCDIKFDTTKLNSIEVSFKVHPSIRQVE